MGKCSGDKNFILAAPIWHFIKCFDYLFPIKFITVEMVTLLLRLRRSVTPARTITNKINKGSIENLRLVKKWFPTLKNLQLLSSVLELYGGGKQ